MKNAALQITHRHWWVSLVRGILALVFGIIALADPLIVLLAFIYVFAVYAILDGITTIVVSLQERSSSRTWWMLLLEGVVGIIFGILVLVWPVKTALVLLYLVAIWALMTGVLKISAAFVVAGSARHRWGLALAGLLSIIFGLILIVHPGAGLLTVLWLVGIFAIVFGLSLIVYAFQVRSRARTLAPARATE
ncbi:MAG: HdeD family acid-resistance protein [Ktedonobacteraceae bacterium]